MKRLVLLCFVLAGCSGPGGGNGGPPNPPPPPRPSVSITTPAPGAQVSGMTTIAASVQNPPAGAMLQFKLDNPSTNIGLPVPATNGSTSTGWNSASASDGPHTLSASLTDGSATSSPVSVMVANTGVSSVSITSPPPGAMLSGTANLNATCANCAAGSSVQFKYDSNNIGGPASVVSGTASQQWEPAGILNGSHILSAQLIGSTVTSQPVAVTLANPQVTFITPPTGSIVSGNVTLSASCSNCPQNSSIQFQDGPNNIGGPAQVAGGVATRIWDTSQVGNGSHPLTAQLVGSLSGADIIVVTVSNPITQAPRIDPPIVPNWFGCVAECGINFGPFVVTGANFASNQTVSTDFCGDGPLGGTWIYRNQTRFEIGLIVDTPRINPGCVAVKVETQFGQDLGHIAYLSVGNNLRASEAQFFVLDPGGLRIAVYDRATQAQIKDVSAGGVTAFDVDSQSGTILTFARINSLNGPSGMGVIQQNGVRGAVMYDSVPSANPYSTQGAVVNDTACVTNRENGLVSTIDLAAHNFDGSTGGDSLQRFDRHYAVGGQPFPAVRWNSGSNQFCDIVDVEGNRLIFLNMTAQTWNTFPINGLRKASELTTPLPAFLQVGFKLATAPGATILAYLHVADRKLKFFNRSTGAEIRTVDLASLTFVPTELAVNPSDNSVILARFDSATGLGHVAKVSQSGVLTEIPGNHDFMIDGILVDGGATHISNRGAAPTPVNLN